jgi:hypothetical protein
VEDSEDFRAVTFAEGEEFCQKHALSGFSEASAKSGQKVEGIFRSLTQILSDKY